MANEKPTVDPALVRELAAILREADLGEIEVEQGDLKIRVSKPAAPQIAAAPIHYAAPPAAAPVAAPAAAAAVAESAGPTVNANEEIIKSPMIGTFYRSPSPEAGTFVEKGSMVNKSTVVCIIEAMKVMNEIKAEITGEIVEILVGDAEPVEYGQPLFKVKKG